MPQALAGRVPTQPPARAAVSAWLYLALCVIAVFDAFHRIDWVHDFGLLLIIAFLILEIRFVPLSQRIVGLALAGAGVFLGWLEGHTLAVLDEGLGRSLTFLLLFFAVGWLRAPAQISPVLNEAREAVMAQPPGRRFDILASAAHGLGAFLNLAGLTLLSEMVARQTEHRPRMRLSVGLMIGFTSASAWSPFYVSVVVILSAMPGVEWTEIVLPGLLISGAVVLSACVLNRVIRRRRPAGAGPVPGLGRRAWRDLFLLLMGLLTGVVGLVELLDLPIPVVLALFAPPFAWIWYGRIRGSRARPLELPGRVVAGLPDLRGESLIFVGANIFGIGAAGAVNAAELADSLNTRAWPDIVKIGALAFYMVLAGAVGVHPVVLVILVGAVLPPEVYGLPPVIMAMTMLGTWGISTTSSPFSATTLFVSRITGDDIYQLAWRWAAPFSWTGALVVTLTAWSVWKTGLVTPSPWVG